MRTPPNLSALLLALLLTLLTAPAPARADCASDVIALRQALSFDPVVLARQNARIGDLRFFEVGRLERTAPGVEDQKCVRANRLAAPLHGSTDTPCSKAHQLLNEKALAYAQQYNEAMIRLRTEQGLPICAAQ